MLARIVSAAAFAVGFSSVAFADGLPGQYAPYLYNWSGFYDVCADAQWLEWVICITTFWSAAEVKQS
jgi:hypothetical protein